MDDNIARLDELYAARFAHRRYLVPFYRGEREDVIGVYESSACFEGYLAQAAPRLIDHQRFSHYLFAADDLLLNPDLNASTFLTQFRLKPGTAYIKQMRPLTDSSLESWPNFLRFLHAFADTKHVHWPEELPTRAQAFERFATMGIKFKELSRRHVRGLFTRKALSANVPYLRAPLLELFYKGAIPLPYPLVFSYSDMVVVPREAIELFCHYCGVFAAMGLWVEIAIPTALALSCDHIMTEADLSRRGLEIWEDAKLDRMAEAAGRQIRNVFNVLGADYSYVHPIKLSHWQ